MGETENMPPVIIAGAIAAAASIAGSVISGKPKTTTSTQTGTSTSTTNGSSTSSTTPTFSGPLQSLMSQLQDYSTNSINNPSSMLQPIENSGLGAINQSYNGASQQVTQQLASRGFGSSGATGEDLYNVANAKAGAQGNLQGQLAQDAVNQSQFGASLGEQLLNTGKGSTSSTTGTSTTTGSSTGTGSTTGPNTMLANGLSTLGSSLTQAIQPTTTPGSAGWLSTLLQNGGGASGAGSAGNPGTGGGMT